MLRDPDETKDFAPDETRGFTGTPSFDLRAVLEAQAHAADVRTAAAKSDPVTEITQREPGVYVLKFRDSHISRDNHVLGMGVKGELEALGTEMHDFTMKRSYERKPYKLVVDLSNINRIEKDAVGALLLIKSGAGKSEGRMALVIPADKSEITEYLKRYRLTTVFTQAESIDAAVSALRTATSASRSA